MPSHALLLVALLQLVLVLLRSGTAFSAEVDFTASLESVIAFGDVYRNLGSPRQGDLDRDGDIDVVGSNFRAIDGLSMFVMSALS